MHDLVHGHLDLVRSLALDKCLRAAGLRRFTRDSQVVEVLLAYFSAAGDLGDGGGADGWAGVARVLQLDVELAGLDGLEDLLLVLPILQELHHVATEDLRRVDARIRKQPIRAMRRSWSAIIVRYLGIMELLLQVQHLLQLLASLVRGCPIHLMQLLKHLTALNGWRVGLYEHLLGATSRILQRLRRLLDRREALVGVHADVQVLVGAMGSIVLSIQLLCRDRYDGH